MLRRFRPTPALGRHYINIRNDFEMVVFESITVSQDLKEITFFSNVSVSTRMILRISYCQGYLYMSVCYIAGPAERNSKLTLAQRHSTCSQGFERCMDAP